MWKGTVFELRGKRYKIQKINSDGVYASKMLDEHKCQKGRPSRFSHADVAISLNIAVEKLHELPKPKAPRTKKWAEREEKEAREKAEVEKSEKVDEAEEEPEEIFTPEEKKAKTEEEKTKAERRAKSLQKLFDLLDDDATVDDW